MQRANPEALEAPPYFNFASDVTDHWALERPDPLPLVRQRHNRGGARSSPSGNWPRLSCQAANFLHACGLRRSDRVLIMLPRAPQWWVAMLGLIRVGAVPVPATCC